ncbi:hypothetical protein BAE44_0023376 [Dichanthelium oligosanthes]|uniref:C2H2-type domain-containing protein n=1 Tax=Dichanthelium oligosanthes TaxID=888268 RepID=A0A1E5URU9_9POAL|nr:hypothetical protein BAE44_0023376 [Dichanthelium oligosanthes]
MDRHTCKLCFRRFHNGRALGGHMRSHVMAAAVTAAYPPLPLPSPPLSLASTSSTGMDDKPAQHKPLASSRGLREGDKKGFRNGGPEFSSGGAAGGESSVVQDGESDTESSPRFAVSRRRSKRARRRAPAPLEAAPDPEQPASSVASDATREEDVAMSLVMLSRDSWTRSRSGTEQHWGPASSEPEQNNDDADEAEHDDRDDARPRSRHQCGACKKVFRSYQALGGHRASVKKGKAGCVPVPPPTPPPAPPSKAQRAGNAPVIHECPFCFRVFESGQALGGHKRTHMPYTGAPAPSTPVKCGDSSGSIDLNVPAAADDDFELSAVYDAEFVSSTRQ